MMAARAMGCSPSTTCRNSQGMVTACESYLPMVKLMRKVLRLNGLERNVRVLNKRSDELNLGVDIPSRADALVSSQFSHFTLHLNFLTFFSLRTGILWAKEKLLLFSFPLKKRRNFFIFGESKALRCVSMSRHKRLIKLKPTITFHEVINEEGCQL